MVVSSCVMVGVDSSAHLNLTVCKDSSQNILLLVHLRESSYPTIVGTFLHIPRQMMQHNLKVSISQVPSIILTSGEGILEHFDGPDTTNAVLGRDSHEDLLSTVLVSPSAMEPHPVLLRNTYPHKLHNNELAHRQLILRQNIYSSNDRK